MIQPDFAPPPPPSSSLGDIFRHLKNYHWLVGALILLGTCPTILQFCLSVGPPWPTNLQATGLSTIALWGMMLWTHANWFNVGQERTKRLINLFLIATVIFFSAYIALRAFFVVDAPDSWNQEAIGIHLKPEWAEILKTGVVPNGPPLQERSEYYLLKANAWNPYAIYPKREVDLIRFALVGTWIFGFASLGALTSVFCLLQERRARIANRRTQSPR